MRVLSINELDTVSGANDLTDAAQIGAVFGGALGVSYGLWVQATGTATLGFSALTGTTFAGLFLAGAAGWEAGNWLNVNTNIQERLREFLDWSLQ